MPDVAKPAADLCLSVVLPAYNESAGIAEAVERYLAALPKIVDTFEVLVIDDCSRDDTLSIARRLADEHPSVRVLHNEVNRGAAGSMLRGFYEARYEYVTNNGVDIPFAPEDTGIIVDALRQGADVVVVERSNREAYSLYRKAVSWANILLIKVLLRSPVVDHNFIQAYRKPVLDAIQVETRGVSTVATELIVKASVLGYKICRLQAPYHKRRTGKSTITVKQIIGSTKELFRLAAVMRGMRARQAANRQVGAERS